MYERTYLFNPFLLMTADDDELSKVINDLAAQYRYSDMAYDIIFDINLEADLLTIYGEFIARFQKTADLSKLKADNLRDKSVYKLRKDLVDSNT